MSFWTVFWGIAAWKLVVPAAIVGFVILFVILFVGYAYICDGVTWVKRVARRWRRK